MLAPIGLAIASLVLSWPPPSNPEVSFLAGDLLPLVTVAAIAIGGIIAIFKFQLFRDSAPHLTITHTISHRLVGNSYLHIAVTAELHNSSKVKMELRQAIFRLQQVVPTSDEDVQRLYAQVFFEREVENLQWPVLEEVELNWPEYDRIIEPGEAHFETYEFIVLTSIKSIIVYTYFHNSRYPRSSDTRGWGRATVHDMIRTD